MGAFCEAMNSSPNFDNLCGYKVIPFFKKMLIYLIQPINGAKMGAILLFNWANHNPIKRGEKVTGKRNGAFNMDLKLT